MAFNPMVPPPALPAPLQFSPPPQVQQQQPFGGQGMAILQAALKSRPQVGGPVKPNPAVNPGAPPAAGDPGLGAPMPGTSGAPQMGMLAKLLSQLGPQQQQQQPQGGAPMMPQALDMSGAGGGW